MAAKRKLDSDLSHRQAQVLALLAADDPRSAIQIHREMANTFGARQTLQAVYVGLSRMVDSGLIGCRIVDARRGYSITGKGRAALAGAIDLYRGLNEMATEEASA